MEFIDTNCVLLKIVIQVISGVAVTFSQKSFNPDAVFVVDNGSLRPSAVLGLRAIAQSLSEGRGRTVEPVSVLHSNKIPVEALDGIPAEVFAGEVAKRLQAGQRRFLVMPLFFGPSRALTEFLPETFAKLSRDFPEAQLELAPPLGGEGPEPDPRLAQAVADRILELTRCTRVEQPVVLVDHGSPVRAVAELRDRVGEQLAALPAFAGTRVAVASMERRSGPDYAFNDPLLENLLGTPGFDRGELIVAQLFLLPGRHAGPEGDIAQICAEAEARHPGLRCRRTDLLGEHPLIADILLDRLAAVCDNV